MSRFYGGLCSETADKLPDVVQDGLLIAREGTMICAPILRCRSTRRQRDSTVTSLRTVSVSGNWGFRLASRLSPPTSVGRRTAVESC